MFKYITRFHDNDLATLIRITFVVLLRHCYWVHLKKLRVIVVDRAAVYIPTNIWLTTNQNILVIAVFVLAKSHQHNISMTDTYIEDIQLSIVDGCWFLWSSDKASNCILRVCVLFGFIVLSLSTAYKIDDTISLEWSCRACYII